MSADLSPDGRHLYVASGSSLVAYATDTGTGALNEVDTETMQLEEAGAKSVALSGDGRFVYVVCSDVSWFGVDSGLFVFERDSRSGALSFLERVETPPMSTNVNISPDGEYLYVASTNQAYADHGDAPRTSPLSEPKQRTKLDEYANAPIPSPLHDQGPRALGLGSCPPPRPEL